MGETKSLRKRQLIKLMDRLPGTVFQYREWPDGGRAFPYSTAAIEKIFFASPKALASDGNLAWSRLTGKSAAELRSILNRSALQLDAFECVIQTTSPQHRHQWVRVHAMPERQSDGSTLWHGHMQDITAQYEADVTAKQNAAFLNMIFENLPDHFYYKDINGRMLGANETCYRHHGFSSESEIIGKTDLELYPGEEGESGFAAEQSMMEAGTTSRDREKIVRKDGRS